MANVKVIIVKVRRDEEVPGTHSPNDAWIPPSQRSLSPPSNHHFLSFPYGVQQSFVLAVARS